MLFLLISQGAYFLVCFVSASCFLSVSFLFAFCLLSVCFLLAFYLLSVSFLFACCLLSLASYLLCLLAFPLRRSHSFCVDSLYVLDKVRQGVYFKHESDSIHKSSIFSVITLHTYTHLSIISIRLLRGCGLFDNHANADRESYDRAVCSSHSHT